MPQLVNVDWTSKSAFNENAAYRTKVIRTDPKLQPLRRDAGVTYIASNIGSTLPGRTTLVTFESKVSKLNPVKVKRLKIRMYDPSADALPVSTVPQPYADVDLSVRLGESLPSATAYMILDLLHDLLGDQMTRVVLATDEDFF